MKYKQNIIIANNPEGIDLAISKCLPFACLLYDDDLFSAVYAKVKESNMPYHSSKCFTLNNERYMVFFLR